MRGPSYMHYASLIGIGVGTAIAREGIGLSAIEGIILAICIASVYVSLYTAIIERS